MLTNENLQLQFIEADELRNEVLSEIRLKNRIESKRVINILGCDLINYILISDDKAIIERIFLNEKVINRIDHINITLWKEYGNMYRSLNIDKDEVITVVREEFYFALLDFKKNFNIIAKSTNIEASFFSYINTRVKGRVIDYLHKTYSSKYFTISDNLINPYYSSWEYEDNYMEVLNEEREVRKELKNYLGQLSPIERDLIISTTLHGADYQSLEQTYHISSATLRKKKERALKKLNNLIPENSILKESA